MSYPNKAVREACWGAKDEYWACLDKNNVQEIIKDGPCQELRKAFENSCSKMWIKHFDRKRNYIIFKQQLETEVPLDEDKS